MEGSKLKIESKFFSLEIGRKMVNPTVGPATMSLSGSITAPIPSSGVYVTETTALNLLAVWGCTQIISQSMAICPLEIRNQITKKEVVHPLKKRLNLIPNPELSAYQFWSLALTHCCLWGNFFAEIERDNAGRVLRLWPVAPWRVYVRRVNGEIMYQVILISGGTVWLRPDQMLHIRGLSTDGLVGLSPIRAGCEAIGLGLAAQVSAGKAFSNDSVPPGVISSPQTMSDGAAARLRASLESAHKGLANSHRLMLLEEGTTFTPTNINPVDAQLLESRKFTREEVAGMYRIPQHKVGILERSTNNNIEQQAIEFVTDTLTPWAKNIAQEMMIKLFTESEQDELCIMHDMSEQVVGDIKTRFGAYAVARQWGWMSANDILHKENKPSIGAKGDIYLTPMNMVPAGTVPDKNAKPPKED